jgi:hypothetical protein
LAVLFNKSQLRIKDLDLGNQGGIDLLYIEDVHVVRNNELLNILSSALNSVLINESLNGLFCLVFEVLNLDVVV